MEDQPFDRAPAITDIPLSEEQLAEGRAADKTSFSQAQINTTRRVEYLANADWLKSGLDLSRSYLPRELCRELHVSTTTLNKYAREAGVPVPDRGHRDHRYSAIERLQIYQRIVDKSSDTKLVEHCRKVLENQK